MKTLARFEFFKAGDGNDVANWIIEKMPQCARGWDTFAAMRVFRDETIGGVVFHDWNPEAKTMCMSAAGCDGWLTRPVLFAMHSYVFNDAGCQLAVLQTAETNKTMRKIALAYGYREYRIPRLRGRDEAEIILTLADDDWRLSRFHKRQNNG